MEMQDGIKFLIDIIAEESEVLIDISKKQTFTSGDKMLLEIVSNRINLIAKTIQTLEERNENI